MRGSQETMEAIPRADFWAGLMNLLMVRPSSINFAGKKSVHAMNKVSPLIDHCIGAYENRRWYGDVEGFCRLQIYDQLELGWLFNRKISGACAL